LSLAAAGKAIDKPRGTGGSQHAVNLRGVWMGSTGHCKVLLMACAGHAARLERS
jgi:hypothetical protein